MSVCSLCVRLCSSECQAMCICAYGCLSLCTCVRICPWFQPLQTVFFTQGTLYSICQEKVTSAYCGTGCHEILSLREKERWPTYQGFDAVVLAQLNLCSSHFNLNWPDLSFLNSLANWIRLFRGSHPSLNFYVAALTSSVVRKNVSGQEGCNLGLLVRICKNACIGKTWSQKMCE